MMGKKVIGNFDKADIAIAKKFNEQQKNGKTDWTADDVKKYRKDNNLTIHECEDGTTCQLVPKSIHEACRHSGGVAELKIIEGILEGVFDE